jgi:hypothetical protein
MPRTVSRDERSDSVRDNVQKADPPSAMGTPAEAQGSKAATELVARPLAAPAPGSEPRTPAPSLPTSSSSRLSPAPKWASARWLALLGIALAELAALWVRQRNVLETEDYVAAAAIVRKDWQSNDAVVIAPEWADPMLRLVLGDRMGVKLAGRVDLASFERLWVLSIRGARAPEAPPRAPDFQKVEHGILIERYDFAPSPVLLDLVDALPSASVEFQQGEQAVPCTYLERVTAAQRGGLGAGPAAPRQRFACEGPSGSSLVGVTVLEDLALQPRRCVLTQPRPNEPVSITYKDVHLGSELVIYAGLYYEDERYETGAPVTMRVLINGHERASFVHQDGDGMKRYELGMQSTPFQAGQARPPVRGDLRLEISASDNVRRSFCWTGSIRDARRREAP